MANPEHVEVLKQGMEVWNRWREENPGIVIDLQHASLQYTNLPRVNLSETDLYEADLSGANLNNANLSRAFLLKARLPKATLVGANLSEADLSGAFFTGADLSAARLIRADLYAGNFEAANLSGATQSDARLFDADLSRANLSGAFFGRANLSGVILFETDMKGTTLALTTIGGVDLRGAKNLDSVIHGGPLIIDASTIDKSQGKIPKSFLRGGGVSENLIQYMSSLTDKDFEYFSCFISYSSKNQGFAERLHADLENKGVHCWFAPEDMKIGDKIRDRIDQSIRLHDKLLLVLSEHSINSEWVEDEVESAYEQEEKRKKTVLFPIRLDEAVMDTDKAWASKLRRSRNIGDFTKWKSHDSYQKAFDRFLRDLKAKPK